MYLRVLPCAFAFVLLAAPAFAQGQPEGDLIGPAPRTYTVVKGDTLASIARQADVGLVELLAANPSVTSNTIPVNQTLILPTQHLLPARSGTGIIVNLAELRLFRFNSDGTVESFPISVGREGWDTPTGSTTIMDKVKDPDWHVPASIRAQDPSLPDVVPAGPDNPLGQYAMHLGWPGYLIHGTNAPASIGKPSSHGCMRLYPEDIEALFNLSSAGDTVTVVETPVTLGQSGGNLYLQVTPTRAQAKALASFKPALPLDDSDPNVQTLKSHLADLESRGVQVDEQAVTAALARHDGMPAVIGRIPDGLQLAAGGQPAPAHAAAGGQAWWDRVVGFFTGVIGMISALFRRS